MAKSKKEMTKNQLLLAINQRALSWNNGSVFKTRKLVEGYENFIEKFYGAKYPDEDYIDSLVGGPSDEEFEKMTEEERDILYKKMDKVERECWDKWYAAIDNCVADATKLLEEVDVK